MKQQRIIEPTGKITTGKARVYLKRTVYRFYFWMTKHKEMRDDVWQEYEIALFEYGYPEDADGIRQAQNALKRKLYKLHTVHGIYLDRQCKLVQRYCQIANPHRFTGASNS